MKTVEVIVIVILPYPIHERTRLNDFIGMMEEFVKDYSLGVRQLSGIAFNDKLLSGKIEFAIGDCQYGIFDGCSSAAKQSLYAYHKFGYLGLRI